jgi:hypothetical protein
MSPLASGWSDPSADLIDQVCDAFEQLWRAGARPRIEEHLGPAEEPLRSRLWAELLLSELECRRRQGEVPALREYLERFPDRHEPLEQHFRDTTPPLPRAASPEPLPDELGPGPVGGYELLAEIGRGGMGWSTRPARSASTGWWP